MFDPSLLSWKKLYRTPNYAPDLETLAAPCAPVRRNIFPSPASLRPCEPCPQRDGYNGDRYSMP